MFAGQAESIYQEYKNKDFAAYFIVLAETPGSPTRQDCINARDKYNLTMPVLYDPQGRLKGAQMNDQDVQWVLDKNGKIVFKKQFDGARSFKVAIDVLLGL